MKSALVVTATVAAGLVSLAALGPAAANPKKLPYSYAPITVPRGALEWETYVDVVPVQVARELEDGTLEGVTAPRYVIQTELEYGLTDRLELGMYLVWRQAASAETPFLRFQGLKQRLRWRLAEPGAWPVDVGLYLEVAELHDELEFEEKLLLRKAWGPVEAVVNLWVEQEWYFITGETKYLYNPTAGLTWELSPAVTLGAEYWMRGRFDSVDADDAGDADGEGAAATKHYLGPTAMVQRGEYWLALGTYVRLDALGTATAVGDGFGRVWVRLILGVGL